MAWTLRAAWGLARDLARVADFFLALVSIVVVVIKSLLQIK